MRPKIVFPILGFGLAILLFFVVVRHGGSREASSAQAKTVEASGTVKSTSGLANSPAKEPAKGTKSGAVDTSASDDSKSGGVGAAGQASPGSGSATNRLTHEEYVDKRVSELMGLAMNDDAASLNAIVSELNNNDADIRKGAIEA